MKKIKSRSEKKSKWLIFILIIAILFFSLQVFMIYFSFIPTVLLPYEKHPEVYIHLKTAFTKVFYWMTVWPLSFLSLVVGIIYGNVKKKKEKRNGTGS